MSLLTLNEFPQCQEIAENWQVFADELKAVEDWVQFGKTPGQLLDYKPGNEHEHQLFLEGQWTIFPIHYGRWSDPSTLKIMYDQCGVKQELAEATREQLPMMFPRSTEILDGLGWLNFAAFSRIHAGSRVNTHTHSHPGCYICHVGIQIPDGGTSGFKVEDDVHIWNQPGDMLVFDDDLPHSAWNDGDVDRVVLFLNFSASLCAFDTWERRHGM
jgi:aspartyl/asparaginyl beta-hydroxylase (cupin superfamily)